ncbi:hypothetical protein HBB16_00650 [Pseudonocardia sp. MCCB 268]|nr:hypothetical protein [Pseudonocardia cytotoxica]
MMRSVVDANHVVGMLCAFSVVWREAYEPATTRRSARYPVRHRDAQRPAGSAGTVGDPRRRGRPEHRLLITERG